MTSLGLAAAVVLSVGCTGTGPGDTGTITWPYGIEGRAEAVEDTERPASLRVAAVEIRFGVSFGEDITVHGAIGRGEIDSDGSFQLGLPDSPPEDALSPLSKVYEETLRGALYWLVVFEDTDNDGHFDVDEDKNLNGKLDEGEDADGDGLLSEAIDRVMGADMDRWLIYLDANETPDDPELSEGWPLGWSLVDLSLSGQYQPNRCLYDTTEPLLWMTGLGLAPIFYDLSGGVEVPLAGLSASLTLAGDPGTPADGVVALPYQHLYQGEDLEKVFDSAVISGTYGGTLTSAPPDSHDVNGDPDWRYTYAIVVPYTDQDLDEQYTLIDDLENATLCAQEQQVYLRYTRPIQRYRGYRFLECYGATVGWRLATTDPESGAAVFWTAEQALSADLDPEQCPLW
jgi:hypothetical protein